MSKRKSTGEPVGRPQTSEQTSGDQFTREVGKLIRKARGDLTLEGLSSLTSGVVSAQNICRYELGRLVPSIKAIVAISLALKKNPLDFLPSDISSAIKKGYVGDVAEFFPN